jgi:ABC-2 type transport system permease protein
MFSGIEVIWDRQFGFLKETLVSPVPRWQIMMGRTLGGATVAIMQGVLVFAISFLVGFRMENWALFPLALVFMAMIALLFTALGTAIASVLEDMHGFQLIMNFLVMPIFFLSGALFPVENLPKVLETLVRINPLAYGVDGLRGTLGGVAQFGLFADFWIMAVIVAILIGVGSYMFNKIQV